MSLVKNEIEKHQVEINNAAKNLVDKYSNTTAKTKGGKIIRFIYKIIPIDFVLKLLQAKIK